MEREAGKKLLTSDHDPHPVRKVSKQKHDKTCNNSASHSFSKDSGAKESKQMFFSQPEEKPLPLLGIHVVTQCLVHLTSKAKRIAPFIRQRPGKGKLRFPWDVYKF